MECQVHGLTLTDEEQAKYQDDETVRHYDGRCAEDGYGGYCAVCYDHSQLGANYTRATIESYLRYCAAEEAHYLSEENCSCTPTHLMMAYAGRD